MSIAGQTYEEYKQNTEVPYSKALWKATLFVLESARVRGVQPFHYQWYSMSNLKVEDTGSQVFFTIKDLSVSFRIREEQTECSIRGAYLGKSSTLLQLPGCQQEKAFKKYVRRVLSGLQTPSTSKHGSFTPSYNSR